MPGLILAPPCKTCGRIFVDGFEGVCNACLLSKRRKYKRAYESVPFCECGRKAVIVVLVQVGTDGSYTERMALCERCQKLEEALAGSKPTKLAQNS